jgi:hypothetical protein
MGQIVHGILQMSGYMNIHVFLPMKYMYIMVHCCQLSKRAIRNNLQQFATFQYLGPKYWHFSVFLQVTFNIPNGIIEGNLQWLSVLMD